MQKTYTKNQEGKLEVTTTPEVVISTQTYDLSFLKKQLVSIQAQKDEQMAQRNIELAEVEALIAECIRHEVEDTEVNELESSKEETK